jgi:hypothetical protein
VRLTVEGGDTETRSPLGLPKSSTRFADVCFAICDLLLVPNFKMSEITVQLRNVHGIEAAFGWAGSHTLIVDRPDGKAGENGLGFNGGELLGLAIGGCLGNDLRYVAHDLDVQFSATRTCPYRNALKMRTVMNGVFQL